MGRAVVLVTLLVAGCVQSELTICDDLACPVGTVCHPRVGCAIPEQLTACAGSDEASACEYRGTPGACVDGICEALDCGNNLITPGEVCDDGNTINGDGCAADCRSDETCGNDAVDIAAGEQCDDGNLVDADGCSADCSLPRCGDGILDGIEECDPTLALQTSRTCEDFGFYTGTLSCNSICRLDPSPDCAGTCGDQIVQTAYEDCDGTPQNATCFDFGYDLGALACSPVCVVDPVRSCNRFGWRDIAATPVSAKFRGDGETYLVFIDDALLLFQPSGETSMGGQFVGADVLGGAILLASKTAVQLRPSTSAAFTALPTPTIPAGAEIADVVFADDATPVALIKSASLCEVHAFVANAWTVQWSAAQCMEIVAKAVDTFVVKTSSSQLEWTFPGGSRSVSSTSAPFHSFELRGNNLITYEYGSGTLATTSVPKVGPDSGTRSIGTGNYHRLVRSGDDFYGITNPPFAVTFTRLTSGGMEQMPGAPSTNGAPNDLYATRDGRIFAHGNARLHELEFLARTNRVSPSTADLVVRSTVAIAADGTLIFCGNDVWTSSGTAFQKISTTASSGCFAAWGRANIDLYAVRGVTGTPALYRWNGTSFSLEQLSGASINATKLAGEGFTVVALLASGAIARKTGVTWGLLPSLPTTCTAGAIAVTGGTIWAAGGCASNATLWRLSGTTWIEVHAEPAGASFSSLLIVDGTIFAATTAAKVSIGTEGGTWTTHNAGVSQLAGASAGVFGVGSTSLKQWNGTTWSPIRTGNSIQASWIAVGTHDLVVLGYTLPTPTPNIWLGYLLPP